MALKQFLPGSVLVAHWSTVNAALKGDVIQHGGAVIVEIPDKCTHAERLEYYEKAALIVAAAKTKAASS